MAVRQLVRVERTGLIPHLHVLQSVLYMLLNANSVVNCMLVKLGVNWEIDSGNIEGDVMNNHQDREVAIHLNGHGHDGIRDMCIKGLAYKKDLFSRRLCEQKIISLLGCTKVLGQGLNVDIRFPQIMLN